MDVAFVPEVAALSAAGILAGLWLLLRGMGGYRIAARVGDTSTSTIASLAAGEVRVSGVVVPAEVTLISPLQSASCVYYRTSIRERDDLGRGMSDVTEERAVGFRVRDTSGEIRVFPRAARWDIPVRFNDRTGTFGEEPAGLDLRSGSAIGMAEPDHAAAVAALLTVRGNAGIDGHPLLRGAAGRVNREYREARLTVGDTVTIVGRAMPFADLADPAEADVAAESDLPADDPIVAANIAEARAAGILLADPEDAWGNAAIPGFGIGRPTRAPELDPAASRPALASAAEAARTERTFDIAPEALVLASAPDVPLLVAHGLPGATVERHQDRFVVGLFGAVLAIASAMTFAVMLSGGFGA
ncbi:MAG: hypothetical protein OEX05_06065 [Chloroflexota bacterium]|nr:hypothetical protein [Chloroflexota bacterium]